MKLIRLKHCMDNEYRVITLDEAFLEALSLSSGCSCEQEEFETNLLNLINENNSFLNAIKDDFKKKILKSWEYELDENVWLSKVQQVENQNNLYLPITTNMIVKNIVMTIHSNEDDFEFGNLIPRIDYYDSSDYKYVLYDVDLDSIDYEWFDIDDDMVEEYSDMNIEDMPPIVIEPKSDIRTSDEFMFDIIDGVHRCHVLKNKNISKIRAYIPVKSTLESDYILNKC